MPEYDHTPPPKTQTDNAVGDDARKSGTKPRGGGMDAQLRALAPDHTSAIGVPDHPQLTKAERADLINRTESRVTSGLIEYYSALGQVEMDALLKAAKTKGLANTLVDLFFLVPLGLPIKAAWSAANVAFSAPYLTGAGAALSSWLLQGARGKVKIDPSTSGKGIRQVTDMFKLQARVVHEHLIASLGGLSDVRLVAAYMAYEQSRMSGERLRKAIEAEITTYRDVVETIGKKDSDYELIRVHVYTRTKPRHRGPWPLWMARKEGTQYRLIRTVPARWKKQSLASHKARFGGDPEHTVAVSKHGHSLYPNVLTKTVDDAFPAPAPRRQPKNQPPSPTSYPLGR